VGYVPTILSAVVLVGVIAWYPSQSVWQLIDLAAAGIYVWVAIRLYERAPIA
jgi:hypothetical protein